MRLRLRTTVLIAAALILPGTARAGLNLVQNGEFEAHSGAITQNTEFGASYSSVGQGVTGWSSPSASAYNLYFFAGTATTTSANSRWGGTQMLTPNFVSRSAGAGNFIAMDGDSSVNGPLQQSIANLLVGETYQVSFYWGAAQLTNRSGATTEQLDVSLGGQDQYTSVVSNPTQGFSGWMAQSFTFKAFSTIEVLSFLSIGTPNGQPPIAVLDGVAVTDVPEPAALGLLGAGLAALGLIRRRRRAG